MSKNVIYYNSVTLKAGSLSRYKDSEVWMFEEVVREMNGLFEEIDGGIESIKQDYDSYVELKEILINSKIELSRLWNEMRDLDILVQQERQCLTKEDSRAMLSMAGQFGDILYRRGTCTLENVNSIKNMIRFLEEHRNQIPQTRKDSYQRVIRLLKDSIHPGVLKDLKESLPSFEMDLQGKQVTFPSGEEGVKEMRKLSDKKMKYDTEKSVKEFLRDVWPSDF